MIRLALLGAWHVHTWMYLPRLLEAYGDAVCFTVVWDEDSVRGQSAARRLATPFEGDLNTALRAYPVDAVIVQCRTTLHCTVVCAAAEAGKHIFCEKVLAPTLEECLRIRSAVARSGVKFMISLDALPYGVYTLARQLIQDGALGEVGTAFVRRVHGMAYGEEGGLPDYWYDNQQTGGGVTIDLATHGTSLLLSLFGLPEIITARMTQRLDHGQDDISTIIADFKGGIQGVAMTSFIAAHLENHVEIIGSRGSLVITGYMGVNEDRLRIYLQSDIVPGFSVPTRLSQGQIPSSSPLTIIAFIRLLSSDLLELEGYTMHDAIRLTMMLQAAYRSAQTGASIPLTPFELL